MSQKKPTAADRPEFRRRALETMKKLDVEVDDITPDKVIICIRASEFNPDDNILWELEENKSAVRPDVHCAGCKSEMAMSNHAYAAYAGFDKKPRVMCLPCLLELSKTEPIDAFTRSRQGASELNKSKP